MSVEILSRIQFGFTLTFHYIYPPLSIGLSLALIGMESMYLKTKNKVWEQITKFWVRVFALTFALGVATGIPLQFSLGANWARYTRFSGDVFGTLLGAEGIFAFLIEAGFLGVLLFGWNRVSSRMHLISTILVAIGAHFSAIWIVSTNSWMQAPSGYRLTTDPMTGERIAQVTNWLKMFLSPLNLSHQVHVFLGAWMAGGFLIISVAAYYFLKKRHLDFAGKSMKVGLIMTFACAILQLVSSDHLGRKVAQYTPVKFAAFEGVYETREATPAYVFGVVDPKTEKVRGLKIPGLLSFMVNRDLKTPIPGLNEFPKEEWPWVPVVFQAFHLMVIMWGAMFITALIGVIAWARGSFLINKWLLRLMVISVGFPQLANIAGWYSSCMGRQPWTVFKLLKTKDAFSAILTQGQLIGSMIMFVSMYFLFFGLFLYLLDKKIKNGPELEEEQLPYRDIFKKRIQ